MQRRLTAFCQRVIRGGKWLQQYLFDSQPPTLEATYDDYAPYIRKVPAPTPESIKTVLEQLSLIDPKTRTAEPDTFIDRSVSSDLEREGFFQRLWR